MTDQVQNQVVEQKQNDKEYNFRAIEAKLQQERNARIQAEEALKLVQESQQRRNNIVEDDEDEKSDDPYIDHKRLKKEQAKLGQKIKQETQSEIHKAVQSAIENERKQNWMKNNSDFHEVMQNAQKLYETDQELAESILEMPDTFERQKLVYKNIKALGLHKPKQPETNVQQKIDANKKSPYYQPSGIGSSPYNAGMGDFSKSGQKNAYDKMQELKNKLRLG